MKRHCFIVKSGTKPTKHFKGIRPTSPIIATVSRIRPLLPNQIDCCKSPSSDLVTCFKRRGSHCPIRATVSRTMCSLPNGSNCSKDQVLTAQSDNCFKNWIDLTQSKQMFQGPNQSNCFKDQMRYYPVRVSVSRTRLWLPNHSSLKVGIGLFNQSNCSQYHFPRAIAY